MSISFRECCTRLPLHTLICANVYRQFFPPADAEVAEESDETPELPEVPTKEPVEADQPDAKKRKVSNDEKKDK